MKDFIKKNARLLILLALILLVRLLSMNSHWVEKNYSNGIYRAIGWVERALFGWIPFSIGDILYGLAAIWVLVKLVKGVRNLARRKATWKGTGRAALKGLLILLSIYVFFNLNWGLNYNRRGIAEQLDLKMDTFSLAELENINQVLADKVNACKLSLLSNNVSYPNNRDMFRSAAAAYSNIDQQYTFLQYRPVSIKSSMWSRLGNYTGFLGYYNPFTGEAQVNTTIPRFLLPYTCCHEIAHQLGYAKENEANFVGYLAAASADTVFKYSVYFDLFFYANRTLSAEAAIRGDSLLAKKYRDQLLPAVKADAEEWKTFNQRHRSFIEPAVRKGYAFYLRRNNQPKGMRSYDEVTTFIIAYYKKFGKI